MKLVVFHPGRNKMIDIGTMFTWKMLHLMDSPSFTMYCSWVIRLIMIKWQIHTLVYDKNHPTSGSINHLNPWSHLNNITQMPSVKTNEMTEYILQDHKGI